MIMNTTSMQDIKYSGLYKPISVSQAKRRFLKYYKLATRGFEVVAQKKKTEETVSIINTSTISAILDAIRFRIEVIVDKGYEYPYTISVEEVPLYGSGDTEESAVENLIDATIEFLDIYKEKNDIYSRVYSAQCKGYALKLLRCGNDRNALRKAYGL